MQLPDDPAVPRRGRGHFEHPHDRDRYASREYEDAVADNRQWREPDERNYDGLASLTNRQWGRGENAGDTSFGHAGQGGYGEDQGPGAQSGHGRGGSRSARDAPQSRDPDTAPVRAGHRGRGPRNYTRPDDGIADAVIERLTDDDQLDASQILIMVDNGVVTLTGEVRSRDDKRRAEDLTDGVGGVRDIVNRLKVDSGASSFGPPGSAVRSGSDQRGSGFSSSMRFRDPADEPSLRAGRAGPESQAIDPRWTQR